MTRGSLPNLRSDLVTGDNSGDSTESLIDEAEDYLRRSIDSMLTISSSGVSSDYWNRQTARRRRTRRYSEPDLIRDWHPPQDARPYLPKVNSIIDYLYDSNTVSHRVATLYLIITYESFEGFTAQLMVVFLNNVDINNKKRVLKVILFNIRIIFSYHLLLHFPCFDRYQEI